MTININFYNYLVPFVSKHLFKNSKAVLVMPQAISDLVKLRWTPRNSSFIDPFLSFQRILKAAAGDRNGVPSVDCILVFTTLTGKNRVEIEAPRTAPDPKSARRFKT